MYAIKVHVTRLLREFGGMPTMKIWDFDLLRSFWCGGKVGRQTYCSTLVIVFGACIIKSVTVLLITNLLS